MTPFKCRVETTFVPETMQSCRANIDRLPSITQVNPKPRKPGAATKAVPKATSKARPLPRAAGDGIQSLQAAFSILDALAEAGRPMGITELASALGELKPRVYRHLSTLKQLGVVYQEMQSGKYRLGSKLFALGEAAVDQFDLRHLAAPYLTKLRDMTQQTAILSVPANGEAIVLSCVEYRDRISVTSRPGNRPPAHCSSQGRIVLAFAAADIVKRVLARKLPAYSAHSITDPKAVLARLPAIREHFYEDAMHEVMAGINTLSAPVFRDGGELAAVVGLLGTAEALPSPPPPTLLAQLRQTAGELSAELNCGIYYDRGFAK